MAGLLDDLANAYGTAGSGIGQGLGSLLSLIRGNPTQTLGGAMSQDTPAFINAQANQNPSIIPISAAEAADAQAQQGQSAPGADPSQVAAITAAQIAARQGNQGAALQAAAPAATDPGLQSASVPDTTVANVNATAGFPSPSDYNSDGTQASPGASASSGQGGLLTALAGASQDAAQDPVKAKGLLSTLGDTLGEVGGHLKSLSPAASQGLLAAGLSLLGNNDGTRNLSQLVGGAGAAGLNQYQAVTQNQIQNTLARQKLAQDLAEKQATNATANYNAVTERQKALNSPTQVEPGNGVITPAMIANGQSPQVLTGPGGTLPVAGSRDYQDAQGNTFTQNIDKFGQPVGAPIPKSLVNTGPLPADRLKVVNTAQAEAANQAHQAQMTANWIQRLSPTMTDPTTGQQVPNPNYVSVPGGIAAQGQDIWTKLTGDQTTGQILRNQMRQQTYQDYLATWKPGIGGRLTNTDVQLLKSGMPPDTASGSTWGKFLQSYGKLQADVANQAQRQATYLSQNRGDMSPLAAPLTFNGMTFPAGTTYAQVSAGLGGTPAQQSGQNGASGGTQGAPVANPQLVSLAKSRGLKQDANGRWYVPK